MLLFFFFMTRRTPISPRSDQLFPYPTLFRSVLRLMTKPPPSSIAIRAYLSMAAAFVPRVHAGIFTMTSRSVMLREVGGRYAGGVVRNDSNGRLQIGREHV